MASRPVSVGLCPCPLLVILGNIWWCFWLPWLWWLSCSWFWWVCRTLCFCAICDGCWPPVSVLLILVQPWHPSPTQIRMSLSPCTFGSHEIWWMQRCERKEKDHLPPKPLILLPYWWLCPDDDKTRGWMAVRIFLLANYVVVLVSMMGLEYVWCCALVPVILFVLTPPPQGSPSLEDLLNFNYTEHSKASVVSYWSIQ